MFFPSEDSRDPRAHGMTVKIETSVWSGQWTVSAPPALPTSPQAVSSAVSLYLMMLRLLHDDTGLLPPPPPPFGSFILCETLWPPLPRHASPLPPPSPLLSLPPTLLPSRWFSWSTAVASASSASMWGLVKPISERSPLDRCLATLNAHGRERESKRESKGTISTFEITPSCNEEPTTCKISACT